MSGTYLLRLLSISLACFFLVNAGLAGLIASASAVAIRAAERMPARRAARFLFAVRLFPAGAALLLVSVLCVPSYLRLEPRAGVEDIGLVCVAGAWLGLGVCGIAGLRGGRALAHTVLLARSTRRSGATASWLGEALPVWIVEGAPRFPLALIGFVRPQLVISRGVLQALSPDQLAAALRHEHAHCTSHDNLKRLLLLLTPGLLPFVDPWRRLDRQWAKLSEWAADDAAAAGSRQDGLSLAGALVRVARACPCMAAPGAIAFLVGSGADLAARVERLLDPAPDSDGFTWALLLAGTAMFLLAGATVALALQPAVLSLVHEALEKLIR